MSTDPTAPVVIVSNDTHIGPRLVEDLRPYCPREHLDDFGIAGPCGYGRVDSAELSDVLRAHRESLDELRRGG